MVDRFPEAFARFERVVDVRYFDSYRELAYAFSLWAGKRWVDSYLQNVALKREGKKLGFKDAELPRYFKPSIGWRETARYGRHRSLGAERISVVNDLIRKGYSANRIVRQLRSKGLGMRRKVLLKHIREMKMKSVKANREKYIPKKYRQKYRK
jgi:hypothetical protein